MKAFSLIELLVVVAIIAILASIAIPAYKLYTLRSRMSAIVPYFDSYLSSVQKYAIENGHFPNTTLSTFVVPNAVSYSVPPNDTCGKYSYQNVLILPSALGFSSSVSQVGLTCAFYTINGTFFKMCGYWVQLSAGGYDPTKYIPTWINTFADGTGNAWNTLNTAHINQASCQ